MYRAIPPSRKFMMHPSSREISDDTSGVDIDFHTDEEHGENGGARILLSGESFDLRRVHGSVSCTKSLDAPEPNDIIARGFWVTDRGGIVQVSGA